MVFQEVVSIENTLAYTSKDSVNAKGIISVEDFSVLENLERYETWGEMTNGIKEEFSEGYKRFN